MATRNRATAQTPRIADRLVAARRGRFVGRSDELELFRSALQAAEPPFAVLYVYGPGGIGKTTLLQEYARRAASDEKIVVQVDGRNIDPTPTGFLFALSQCLELEDVGLAHVIAHWPATGLLLIDRYEILTALDGWLRETFLPQLPAQSLVVIASRNPPTSPWRTDIDWAELTRIAPLRDLRPDECQTYLTTRGISDDLHADILAFTHGHPLALALVADVLARGGKLPSHMSLYQPEPDVVRVLLERLVQDVPSAAHRLALDICVRMWATTETLLGDMLDEASGSAGNSGSNGSGSDAHTLFEWLRQLPFIEEGPFGLFPHDLAREVLDADWRWRNPESFRQLTYRLFAALYGRFVNAHGMEQQRIWFYLLYLCRHSPLYRPYYEWSALGSAYAEVASAQDYPTILALIARHLGEDSAKIAAYWLERQPQAFRVFRYVGGDVFGFMAHLLLRQPSPEDIAMDAAMQSAVDFIARHGPLRQDEEILFARFWMNSEGFQGVSPGLNLAAINTTIDLITHPRLAWNFINFTNPEFIEPHFTAVHFWRSPEADYVVDDHRFGVFAHDWRVEPAMDWLHVKASLAADPNLTAQSTTFSQAPSFLVLSQPEFADAVRKALRDYSHTDELAANPLMQSRLVADVARQGASPEALRALIREAVASLAENPKDVKFHRAIWHTYIESAPTQERAAELLGLPFNTYRYHLANGIERITDWLWQRELNGASN
jgi:hypothetical protein